MKKILVLLAAGVAALLAVSCAKETVNDNFAQAGMKKVTITASVEEMTKTTYSETGAFSWTKGDKVSVLGDDKNFYVLTAEETGARVEFSGDIPNSVELTGRAFYPADKLHACIDGNYQYNIPEYKDLTTSFSADLPMVSDTDGEGVYSFKHMTGAALLSFSNLEDYVAVEVTITNASLKISGLYSASIDNETGFWTYGAEVAPDGGSKFTRKLAVVDGGAQVYFPYPSNLWADSTIDIVGFDADGKEFQLLSGKTMKANYDAFPRATVIPYATLIVPDYVLPSEKEELKDLDWASEDVVTYTLSEGETTNVALTELNVLVSEQFMNVRVKCVKDAFAALANPAMSVFLFDGDPAGTETYYDFWITKGTKALTKEHTGVFAGGNELSLKVNGAEVETITTATDTEIIWTYAIPRATAEAYANDKGFVYFGVLLDEGWNQVGALPSRGSSMLKVKLFHVEGVEDELEAKDLPKLDWASASVAENDETSEDFKMKEIRAFGDSKYIYVRLTTAQGAPLEANYLDVSFCDGDGENSVWWGWTTTGTNTYYEEHKGAIDAAGNLSGMSFSTAEVLCHTEVAAESVTWYLAYPRESVADYVSSTGKIYVSSLVWNGWGVFGAAPARGEAMLEVTLP